ncbi:MAG: 50S ribosome-binding GTPase [Candidatus Micrarchaeota archaeon]|nr:50S ribosome-binding GTPase [Candidatus Micrarchaeota archaeon]MDE1849811.1 50S ribosome-binding GTPase [Candidatus Micrarchaeota archaeon]
MAGNEHLSKKLEELQEEYSKTKYNKATNKHLGLLRAKIANIRKEMEQKHGRKGTGFSVKKTGDATVALVGFPNAGKSSLLKKLTDVESKVADYAFTTIDVIPGMMGYSGANIQVLDLPGLIVGARIGKGEGRKIISVVRVSDMILFLIDAKEPSHIYSLIDELEALNIRVNKKAPSIKFERKDTLGMKIESGKFKVPDRKTIIDILKEFGIFNAEIIFWQDSSVDDLLDVIAGNCTYMKGIVALNKIDVVDGASLTKYINEIRSRTGMAVIPISVTKSINIEQLKAEVFSRLDLVRLYLKPRDGKPDFEKPMIMKKGATVMDVAKKLNSKTAKNAKFANITGSSAKFVNQKVGTEHEVADGDVITMIYDKA